MKILVLSDSHSSMQFMRRCVSTCKPDAIIHLGDHYDDAEALAEEYPNIPLHQVAGNCDRYRCPPSAREMLCYEVCGVRLFMVHGHNHYVKQGTGALLADARRYAVCAALYGHTHQPDCRMLEDGMWVLNPGSCGYGGRTAGIIEVREKKIITCRVITQADLEEML